MCVFVTAQSLGWSVTHVTPISVIVYYGIAHADRLLHVLANDLVMH